MEQMLATLPFPLVPAGPAADTWQFAEGALTAVAAPRTDFFIDPAGATTVVSSTVTASEPARLLGVPAGDFQLAARVSGDFSSAFDAGVLCVYVDENYWAKLCLEYTPQHRPSVVSVVTRGVSDDANAFELDESTVWLRVSRTGQTYAFHASTDGKWWRMIRYFALTGSPEGVPVQVGFLVQSPTGEGCRVTFDDLGFTAEAPADLRDGS